MKKVISILLVLCMLMPFAAHAFAANTYTPEELEELKQKAEGGDAVAMSTLGNLYYRGNYNSGITRDFSRALDWFLRAADAGSRDVLMNIATIYEKGSAGERNSEKAYNWYKRALEAGIAEAQKKLDEPQFADFRWKDNAQLLTGSLGAYETVGKRDAMPLYLDRPVLNCTGLSMQLRILEYTGWPFGEYAVYAKDLNGTWQELTRFQIEKFQADGEPRTYDIKLASPISFQALAVALTEDGMEFNLTHEDLFYVDKLLVSDYSAEVPAPVYTPSGAQYPVSSSAFYASAYVNPYPGG